MEWQRFKIQNKQSDRQHSASKSTYILSLVGLTAPKDPEDKINTSLSCKHSFEHYITKLDV